MSVWTELRRRKVFQVAIAYAIVGWLVAQVAALTFPVLLVPDVVLRSIIVVLLLGFPVALVLAWAYEITPDSGGPVETTVSGSASAATAGKRQGFAAVGITAGLAAGLLAGFSIAYLTDEPPVPSVDPKTPVPLTANPDSNSVFSAAISPDGSQLVYADNTGMYLRLVQTGETHALTLPSDMNIDLTEIDWMPDGTNIVFTGARGDTSGLWRASIYGGDPQLLRPRVWRASVSPDGQQIAYFVERPARTINIMNADGGNTRELVNVGGDSAWELAWSPDSRWLVYGVLLDFRVGRIHAIDPTNGNSVTMIEGEDLWQNWRGNLPFQWTPDERLIFAKRNPPPSRSTSNLWQIGIDPDSAATIGTATPLTNLTGYNFAELSMPADGSRLSFLLETNQSDVYVGRLADDNASFSDERRLTFDLRNDGTSGWSPDGNTLFVLSERGVTPNLFRMSRTGGNVELIGSSANAVNNSSVSPDGQWLLYWQIEGGELILKRQPIGGGPAEETLRRPTIGATYIDCPTSIEVGQDCILGEPGSDNRYVFTAINPVYGLGRELLSVEDRPPFRDWSLSPDGQRIALVHNDGPARVIELGAGTEREISRDGWLLGEFVDWSRDGRGLFMDAQRGSSFYRKALVYVPLDSDEVHILRRDPNEWHVRPSTSPDGRELAFSLMNFAGNAWMVENP